MRCPDWSGRCCSPVRARSRGRSPRWPPGCSRARDAPAPARRRVGPLGVERDGTLAVGEGRVLAGRAGRRARNSGRSTHSSNSSPDLIAHSKTNALADRRASASVHAVSLVPVHPVDRARATRRRPAGADAAACAGADPAGCAGGVGASEPVHAAAIRSDESPQDHAASVASGLLPTSPGCAALSSGAGPAGTPGYRRPRVTRQGRGRLPDRRHADRSARGDSRDLHVPDRAGESPASTVAPHPGLVVPGRAHASQARFISAK